MDRVTAAAKTICRLECANAVGSCRVACRSHTRWRMFEPDAKAVLAAADAATGEPHKLARDLRGLADEMQAGRGLVLEGADMIERLAEALTVIEARASGRKAAGGSRIEYQDCLEGCGEIARALLNPEPRGGAGG